MNLEATRKANNKLEIENIGRTSCTGSITQAITKVSTSDRLQTLIDTGTINHQVWQWIKREDPAAASLHIRALSIFILKLQLLYPRSHHLLHPSIPQIDN